MSAETSTEPERRSSGSNWNVAAAAMDLPAAHVAGAESKCAEFGSAELGIPAGGGDAAAGSRGLPRLWDYKMRVSWVVYLTVFLFSAIRQGVCNYLTASGIGGGPAALLVSAQAVRTVGIMLSGFWLAQTLLGPRCRSQLIILFAVWSTVCYSVVFQLYPSLASLTVFPNVLLALIIGMSWSKRGRFALVMLALSTVMQVLLTFIINSLPLIQSKLSEAAQQFLVPALKMVYMSFVSEVMTLTWKKMYKRPCSPHVLTTMLMIGLVSTETMGVVGLLAAVDSANIWSNAAIFCVTTIVMETNSRSGILASFIYKLMGKKYRFSDAAHILRWGKTWGSYSWVCGASGFVAPAVILGLKVEDSNFSFLRWEPWALLGIYVLQQMVTDLIYICVQHYIRPSPTLSQTAARCLVLGEATPLFGENKHLEDDGPRTPKTMAEEEFEPAGFKVGCWNITGEMFLTFVIFEYTMSVWNNYVRGQFCTYGTFLPSEAGSCN